MDIVGRIGYHPGVRIYVPPPPPPPPATARGRAGARAVGEGAVQSVHGRSRQDVDGHRRRDRLDRLHGDVCVDALPRAPSPTHAAQQTPWTAPNQEGPVPVTVTVTCPQDGKTASDTVTIQVVRPAVKRIRLRGRALRLRPL